MLAALTGTVHIRPSRLAQLAPHRNASTYQPYPLEARQTFAFMTSALRSTRDHRPSSWTIVDMSPSAYSKLSAAASALVKDESLSDDILLERARGYLKVLELPQFAHLNAPLASQLPISRTLSERIPVVTAGRFFNALLQTADDLDLDIGRRFPPAEVCACAQLLVPVGGGDPPPLRLAKELSALVFGVWWLALNRPCEYLSHIVLASV